MKIIYYLFVLVLLSLASCKNNELKKDEATRLVAKYYGFNLSEAKNENKEDILDATLTTQIALDSRYEGYGWPPGTYKKLENQGYISQTYTNAWMWGYYNVKVTEKGNQYYNGTRIWQTQTSGKVKQYLFKGYMIKISNISISSNAKEKTAEAEVEFTISDISPIQEIFSPVKNTQFKSTVYFKLYDTGWKAIDKESSHLKINLVENPLHWMGD